MGYEEFDEFIQASDYEKKLHAIRVLVQDLRDKAERCEHAEAEKARAIDKLLEVRKQRDALKDVLSAIIDSPEPNQDLIAKARALLDPPRREGWEEINNIAKAACGMNR